MTRILTHLVHTDTWFERLSIVSYYSEAEFEDRILQHSSELFKEYYVLPFKQTLAHSIDLDNTTTPDLVFIKRDYSEWWLVEVEKHSHTYDHVEGQVTVMKSPKINPIALTKYIKSKENFIQDPHGFSLDEQKLELLIKTTKPKVMVVVDNTRENWLLGLKKLNVKLCVVQVYRNTYGEEIYRIKGQYPYIFMDAGHCRTAKAPQNVNTLEVINPDILKDIKNSEEVDISYEGELTKWNLIRTSKKVYIKSIGKRYPLRTSYDYFLRVDANNKFFFTI